MTDIEQAIAWYEGRAEHTPMAGTKKMFQIALEALREKAEREQDWIRVEDRKPDDFVSVLGHMTDAKTVGGEFPSVRECYMIDGQHFFFPALSEVHPVDKWREMPAPKEE